jgi:broad specificity phosphatase PhoE
MANRPHYLTPTKASTANSVRGCQDPPLSSNARLTSLAASTFPPTLAATTPSKPPATAPSKSLRYRTPTKSTAKSRQKGIPPRTTPKRLYLIRHGQSMGQVARKLGMDRQRDPRLRDASLTKEGLRQAHDLIQYEFGDEPELIVSSPLTRALHTALVGFPNHSKILIHYDLAEVGSRVPENTPRPMQHVLRDLDANRVDSKTLLPDTWPTVLYDGSHNRIKAIRRAMQYLFEERIEETIAVVCHFNVIRLILGDNGRSVQPQNATPIPCELQPDGQVVLLEDDTAIPRKQLNYS